MSSELFKELKLLALELVTQTHLLLPNFKYIIKSYTATTTKSTISFFLSSLPPPSLSSSSSSPSSSTSASKILNFYNHSDNKKNQILISKYRQLKNKKNQFLKQTITRCQGLKLNCVTISSN